MRYSRMRQLADMTREELLQVLIRDIRKIPTARVKRRLNSYWYCKQKIDGNLDEIQRLRSLMQKVTVTYRDAPGGGTGADAADRIDKISRLENEIKAEVERLKDEYVMVQFLIDCLDDYKKRSVLNFRYINGFNWADIAENLHYSEDYVKELHGRALKDLLVCLDQFFSKNG